MLLQFTSKLRELLPKVVVSSPDASIYSVVDVRHIVKPGFDAMDFVHFCATEGAVDIEGQPHTLLTAPMAGFYSSTLDGKNPGLTQMRIAYVVSPEQMAHVPVLFAELLKLYEARR